MEKSTENNLNDNNIQQEDNTVNSTVNNTEVNLKDNLVNSDNIKENEFIEENDKDNNTLKEENNEKTSNLQEMKKTRFPLSRIKKLIQEDEEIGKTSSAVPVALSKALELFIEEVVGKLQVHKKIYKENVIEVMKEYEIFKDFNFAKLIDECKKKSKEEKTEEEK